MRTVAALFIDNGGPYPHLRGVECWFGWLFDAFKYAGPHPVVAHPPCGPWGKLKRHCTKQDPRCAPFAVDVVRRWGGVLEHPAGSGLWKVCGLPLPGAPPDAYGGRTFEVSQVEWGHLARKRTWLYVVGAPSELVLTPPFPGREPTHWCSGFRSGGGRTYPEHYKRTGCAVPPGIKVCSAEQRRRTPPAFAQLLVDIARSSSALPGAIPFEACSTR